MSAGDPIKPSSHNVSMCMPPKPSISRASRETKCFKRSTAWAGQTSPPMQRRAASPPFVPPDDHSDRNRETRKARWMLLFSFNDLNHLGITSPALWTITQSPLGYPYVVSVCYGVSLYTETPPTIVGSRFATGVNASPAHLNGNLVKAVSAFSAGNYSNGPTWRAADKT